MTSDSATPAALDLKDSQHTLVIRWQDESETRLAYRALRLECRCALCIEEMTGRPLLDPDSVPADVGVVDCKEVGLYGIQIEWTDGHKTGIYTWARLKTLGEEK